MKRLFHFLPALLILLAPDTVVAEQSQEFGDYIVHYIALPTEVLDPAVAERYNIRRSQSRVMLNVTVMKKGDDGIAAHVDAEVDATATNLAQQLRKVEMRPIKESDAVYYIGEFNAANLETFKFVVTIRVAGLDQPLEVEFSEQFFSD